MRSQKFTSKSVIQKLINSIVDTFLAYDTKYINAITPFLNEHIQELSRNKKIKLKVDKYGFEDDSAWIREINMFIKNFDKHINHSNLNYVKLNKQQKNKIVNYIDNTVDVYLIGNPINIEVENLTPLEYEHYCAEKLKEQGWDAKVTTSTGDQGVDVLAYKNGISLAVQCKKYSKNVGNKAVQEIIAGKQYWNCRYAAVITNSNYTKAAIELANISDVYLLTDSQIKDINQIIKLN